MTISQIYKKYKIMPSLQVHQYRVAQVAMMICENFKGKIDTDYVVSACLLHDMGNILKFDLSLYPQFLEPEGLEYWQNIKNEFEDKYGKDETEATLSIAKELDVTLLTIDLIDAIGYSKLRSTVDSKSYEVKIVSYADTRVTPYGVTSLEERMREGITRFEKNKGIKSDESKLQHSIDLSHELEKQIFQKSNILPSDINHTKVESQIKNLHNFQIV